ncbi:MAG: PAS domain S-box protein [Candidatus Marinimicrobia bacterium]|nr:PAS domain S-box protein [Candidatus Neomarinimicrobiota bacterium]
MGEKDKSPDSEKIQELFSLISNIALKDLKVRRKKSDKNDPMYKVLKAAGDIKDKFDNLEKNKDQTADQSPDSTQILNSLLQNTPAGIAVLEGPDFRYLSVNQNLAKLNGLSVKEHLGKTIKEVLPDAAEKLLPVMRKIMKDGKPVLGREFSITLPKDPDKPVHLIDYLFPIPDEHGKPIGIGAIVLDITQRKEAEENLTESEKMFKVLFDNAPDAYYLNDLTGTFIDGNIAAEEVIGYKKEELIGKNFLKLKLLNLSDIPRAAKLLALNLFGKPTGPDEFVLSRKDGSQVTVEIMTHPVKIGGKRVILGAARDITDRKEMENALQKAKDELEDRIRIRTYELSESNDELVKKKDELQETMDQLKVILDSQPLVTYTSKADGDFGLRFVTDNVFELTGYEADEFLAKSSLWIDNVHPDDVDSAVECLSKLTDGELGEQEYRWLRADGTYIWINESMRLVKDHIYNDTHIVGMLQDITERKESEIELQESENSLKRALHLAQLGHWEWILRTDEAILSDEYYEIFKLRKDEPYGTEEFLKLIHPDDRVEFLEIVEKSKGENRNHNTDYRIVLEGNEIKYIHSEWKVHKDSENIITRLEGTVQDVTERKIAETVLRESEEKLKLLMEKMPEGLAVSIDGKIVFSNQENTKLFGYERDELLNMPAADFIHPTDRERAGMRIKEIMEGAEEQYTQYRMIKRDGSVFSAEVYSRLIEFEGSPALLSMIRDITQRQAAEQQFRDLLESAPDGMVIANESGIIVRINTQTEKIFGYGRDELIGKKVEKLIPKNFHSKHKEHRKHFNSDPITRPMGAALELSGLHKDGHEIPIEISLGPLETPEGMLVIAAVRDISDKKELSDKLTNTLSTLQSIMNTTYDGIYVVDNKMRPVYYNDNFLSLVGLKTKIMNTEEVEKRIKTILHLFKDPDAFMEKIEYYIENPQEEGIDILEFKNGKIIERHSAPHMTNGKIVGRIWSFKDITAARMEESKRKEVEKKLQTAERMESLGVLAGGVAHDLNNVLGPILAYPDLILQDLPEDTPVKSDLLDIKEAATAAAAIISDLLTLARRGRYHMEPLNINDVISSYLNSSSFKSLKKNNDKIKLEMHLTDDMKNIEGSSAHLYKVIMNLVQNAFEAIPRSGIISIHSYSDRVKAQSLLYDELKEGEYIILKVTDSGSGVSEEDISHIFEPFYSKKKMGKSGSGLGLSVVWSVVKDHDGYIDVESAKNKGTEIRLYFPVTGETKKPPEKSFELVGGDESILVVDDEARQRVMAERVLSSLGYNVTTVANKNETLNYLKSNDVDLVILDMVMENENEGLEIFKKIKEIKPNQKAIIVSGFSESEYVKEAKKVGVGKYIKKPYTMKTLGNAVRKELNRK